MKYAAFNFCLFISSLQRIWSALFCFAHSHSHSHWHTHKKLVDKVKYNTVNCHTFNSVHWAHCCLFICTSSYPFSERTEIIVQLICLYVVFIVVSHGVHCECSQNWICTTIRLVVCVLFSMIFFCWLLENGFTWEWEYRANKRKIHWLIFFYSQCSD